MYSRGIRRLLAEFVRLWRHREFQISPDDKTVVIVVIVNIRDLKWEHNFRIMTTTTGKVSALKHKSIAVSVDVNVYLAS